MTYLLDVNVMLALSWPAHIFHHPAERWFGRVGAKSWATCPMVEAGFVRILSNPAFSAQAVSLTEAVRALEVSSKHPGHEFWPDDAAVADALALVATRIAGHQQITDAYLLALAVRHKGRLATFDKGLRALCRSDDERAHLELIV